MDRILITGGGGFIGSHVAEYFAKKGNEVVVFDNLSRAELLGNTSSNARFNWKYLEQFPNIQLIHGDIRRPEEIEKAAGDMDAIIHTAAQTAVTTSLKDPRTDFEINAFGTLNVCEAARKSRNNPALILCSTNKVYGDNVNRIPVREAGTRYEFADDQYRNGIPEQFPTDHCEHSPYGCSKYTADIYVQDYAGTYGLKTGVFRMSCIYGTRQFGVEDQGWVAWFIIATLTGKPITIFGDGKQVRDILFVDDLVRAYDAFLEKGNTLRHGVYNMGGGAENTISLIELLELIRQITGITPPISYAGWRPSDQKVYISDIRKAMTELGWKPKIHKQEGVKKLIQWVTANRQIFS